MKTAYLGIFVFLLGIYLKATSCETRISHAVKSKRSLNKRSGQESYNMFISEQGSHFNEKITFNKVNKTVTYHVPAHRDISESDFMIDFHLNVKVLRLPGHGVCYLRSRSPSEPSMEILWKSMDMVSSGKYKVRNGSRLLSSEWAPTELADVSKLTTSIIEFCQGLTIYKIERVEQDGVTVSQGIHRRRRQALRFPFCRDAQTGYPELQNCPRRTNYVTKCKFPSHSCVYWVTCEGGVYQTKASGGKCDSEHELVNAICCDLACP